ncbi:PhoH family protein, partial [Acinetobacter baumannii]
MAPKRKVEKHLVEKTTKAESKVFYLEFLTPAQKLAWNVYQNHDVVFLTGPAGTGKSHLAVGFALQELFAGTKQNVV